MANGHVFVLRGKIGKVVADAAVIPTDSDFTVEPMWRDVTGDDPHLLEPAGWKRHRWGRGPANRSNLWFLDVVPTEREPDGQFERLSKVFADILAAKIPPKHGRSKPLVVVPAIGTSGGGMGDRRGEVVKRLLRTCQDFVARHDIDIAVVTPTASNYAALQHERRSRPETYFPGIELAVARDLGDRAAKGSLALLIAAGVSMGAGAPSWNGLIEDLASRIGLPEKVRQHLGDLTALDQAQLLQDQGQGLSNKIKLIMEGVGTPSVAHTLLAALDCQSAVTTNYDKLYERAVEASGDRVVTVLPHQFPSEDSRWVLKMHGDMDSSQLVLSRSQFVDFEGSSGPAGSVVQSLLLTSHLLIVGASMTDDNLLRLIYEVSGFRERHHPIGAAGNQRKYGTVLYVGDSPAREALHEEHFQWEGFGEPKSGGSAKLEVFLDAVAMFAADDKLWLLDPAFNDLLPEEDGALAKDARRLLLSVISSHNENVWRPLRRALEELGARLTEVESAEHIATAAHASQRDKLGAAYIEHPRAVALYTKRAAQDALPADEAQHAVAAAWLHDVLEDTQLVAGDLRTGGITERTIEIVQLLTRNKSCSDPRYYEAIRRDPAALLVKTADLASNLDPDRVAKLPSDLRKRLDKKYSKALAELGIRRSQITRLRSSTKSGRSV